MQPSQIRDGRCGCNQSGLNRGVDFHLIALASQTAPSEIVVTVRQGREPNAATA